MNLICEPSSRGQAGLRVDYPRAGTLALGISSN
jgi:hypothetical protein